MRIVHILKGKANPETLNGINKAVHLMANGQSSEGHSVEVWGLAESMTLPPQKRAYRLRLFPLTRLRITLGRELKAALSALEPGTWIHFHSAFIPEFPEISKLLRKRGLAYGITPHSGYAAGVFKKNPWRKRIYVALHEARFVRNASWIQAVGASEMQDILKISAAARVVLIPNGQEPLFAPSPADTACAERPLIGFCGRLATQHKGLDYLIEGFASYKAKGGAGELWLIGEGAERASLEKCAAKRGAARHIRFFGAKHGEEKLNLVAGVDAFIHSSRWEGLPTACLEAAALGRPLVVSRETNLAEYVERWRAGLTLDETSAAGVERALEKVQQLYVRGELAHLGAGARSLVEKELRWENNARSFIDAITACGVSPHSPQAIVDPAP